MDVIVYGAQCAEGKERETAYGLLMLALSREFGMDTMPEIEKAAGGKPFFPDFPTLHFNVSHSHGAAVVAIHDKDIGIDIEKLRPAPKRLSSGMSDAEFFRCWTEMEATVKRQGGSIAAVLRQTVEADPLCCTFEDFLPGWIVTVCPAEESAMQCKVIREEQL